MQSNSTYATWGLLIGTRVHAVTGAHRLSLICGKRVTKDETNMNDE